MPSERRTLRRLGEALLNATLMLVVLVLLLGVVLVMQLRGLGSDLRADLAGMQARSAEARAQAQEALSALDAARSEGGAALPGGIARARADLQAALDGWDDREPTPGDDALIRRMVLAAVAAAAREMQAVPDR